MKRPSSAHTDIYSCSEAQVADSILHIEMSQKISLQVPLTESEFLQDYCPMQAVSPMMRCAPQPAERAENLDMRRNLFGMVMKKWPSENSTFAEDSLDSSVFFV